MYILTILFTICRLVFPSSLTVYQTITLLVLGTNFLWLFSHGMCVIIEPLLLISGSLNLNCFNIVAFFVIVSYMDTSTLYCTSENLFESLRKATAFCVITGETTIITENRTPPNHGISLLQGLSFITLCFSSLCFGSVMYWLSFGRSDSHSTLVHFRWPIKSNMSTLQP